MSPVIGVVSMSICAVANCVSFVVLRRSGAPRVAFAAAVMIAVSVGMGLWHLTALLAEGRS